MRTTKRARLQQQVEAQKRWIAEHGGNLAGYVERYGVPGHPDCYGNGGAAIYAADTAALAEYERQLTKA